jgi:hypothetical protein
MVKEEKRYIIRMSNTTASEKQEPGAGRIGAGYLRQLRVRFVLIGVSGSVSR